MARTRDIAAQRDMLSSATWEVMTERGIAGLTVRAVAAKAGCTTGLVFHTFPTKKDLLIHARQLLLARAASRLDDAEKRASTPRRALDTVAGALLTSGLPTQDESRVWVGFLAASIAEPGLAEHHLNGNRALLRRLERLISAVRPEWLEDDVAALASQIGALSEGFNSASILDPASYPRRVQEQAMTTLVGTVDGDRPPKPDR